MQEVGPSFDFSSTATRGEVAVVLFNLVRHIEGGGGLQPINQPDEHGRVNGLPSGMIAYQLSGIWGGVMNPATAGNLD